MAHEHHSSPSPSPGRKSLEDGAYSVDSAWASDPRNPFNWPLWKKWSVMAVTYWVAIWVGINATSFTTPAIALSEDFNVDNSFFEYSFFAVTSWNAAAAIVPLATLPMLETYGFRIGYVVCTFCSSWYSTLHLTKELDCLYSVRHLHHPAMCRAEFCNFGGLPSASWSFRWNGSKCCGWSCGQFIFYCSGADPSFDTIRLFAHVWCNHWSGDWGFGETIGLAMVSLNSFEMAQPVG